MAKAIIPAEPFPHSGTSPGAFLEVSIYELRYSFWTLQSRLRDFLSGPTQNKKDENVRSWIQKVRCLVYAAENVVDLFTKNIEYSKRGSGSGAALKSLKKIVFQLTRAELKEVDKFRNVVKTIESIVVALIRFAEDKGVGLGRRPSRAINEDKVERMLWPQVEEYCDHEIDDYQASSIIMFEMKRDIEKLLPLLIDDDHHYHHHKKSTIVSILGVGGSGKATLARKIYHHIKTRTHFAAFAWVSMSTQYYQNDYKIVRKDILKQLSKSSSNSPKRVNNTTNREEEDLSTELRETKCLVVLLNVRNKQVVEGLMKSLFWGPNIKLLLTTSDLEVAKLGFTHEIIGLNENEAWEILNKRSYRQPLPDRGALDELVFNRGIISRISTATDTDFGALVRDTDYDARIKEHMGRIMVRKCGYLPIAIFVLAEILRFTYQWKNVGERLQLIDESRLRILWDSLLSKLQGNNLRNNESQEDKGRVWDTWIRLFSRNNEPPEDKGKVGETLNRLFYWSYDELSDEIRECFLYLSHFAEEEYVDVETLCLMWIADGLVKHDGLNSRWRLLDIAELYLTVLARRYLVEVKVSAVRDFRSRYESCRVTSRMRGPWLKELREQSGYLEILKDDINVGDRVMTTVANASRMLVSTNRGLNENDCEEVAGKVKQLAGSKSCERAIEFMRRAQVISSTTSKLMMRVLLFRNTSGAVELPPRITLSDELAESIKGVRVLVFESFKFEDNQELEKVLEKLILLRFLSFKNSELDELPSSACTSSTYLEALDLRVAWGHHIRIPNTFWKAKRLTYLFFSDTSMEVVDGKKLRLSGLDNLEVLVNFQSDIMEIGDISELKNLGVLKAVIRDNNSLSWIVRHKLKCDLYLRIRGCDSEHVPKLQGEKESSDDSSKLQFLEILGTLAGNKLPTYIQVISTGLVELVLVLSEIHPENDPMKTLEKFPNLQRLVLGNRAFLGQEMVCSQSGFPSLKSICLTELADLKQWKIANGAMPNLNRLVIKRCSKLELPEGLNNFSTTLKQLSTWSMPKRFNDSVRDLGLKWDRAECSFSFNLELKDDI